MESSKIGYSQGYILLVHVEESLYFPGVRAAAQCLAICVFPLQIIYINSCMECSTAVFGIYACPLVYSKYMNITEYN